jgi:hypothetical protein
MFSKGSVVLTADRTLMSNYHHNGFLGFGATAPSNIMPEWLFQELFCPPIKTKNGIPAEAPYPGTPIFRLRYSETLLLTRDWPKYTAVEPVMQVKDMNEKQLKSFLQKVHLSFYLKPKIVWDWLRNKQFTFIKTAIK